MKKISLVCALAVLFTLVSCGTQVAPVENTQTPVVENSVPETPVSEGENTPIEDVETPELIESFTYELQEVSGNIQQLIQTNIATQEEQVLITDIKDTIFGDQQDSRIAFKIFAIPKKGDVLFLKTHLIDTDNPAGDIFSFHTRTKEFKKLKINDGFFSGFQLSPDNTKYVFIEAKLEDEGKDTRLDICDLLLDMCNTKVQLSGNETFNAGMGAMTNAFEITWGDDTTIEYSVFDQTKKSQDTYYPENKNSIFIESRILSL